MNNNSETILYSYTYKSSKRHEHVSETEICDPCSFKILLAPRLYFLGQQDNISHVILSEDKNSLIYEVIIYLA